jgi:hypothetical protein
MRAAGSALPWVPCGKGDCQQVLAWVLDHGCGLNDHLAAGASAALLSPCGTPCGKHITKAAGVCFVLLACYFDTTSSNASTCWPNQWGLLCTHVHARVSYRQMPSVGSRMLMRLPFLHTGTMPCGRSTLNPATNQVGSMAASSCKDSTDMCCNQLSPLHCCC